ncbi:MAG TPA: nitroreductase family deazaflavin-dependent oxidoreductase [Acidimicrobiia bacterium]
MNRKDEFMKVFTRFHNFWYKVLGGRVVGRWGKAPMLLLTTTGRKTGKARTTPLLYLPDGDDLVVVASWGGDDRHPLWYLNLQAEPHVEVQVGSEKQARVARTATKAEKARIWPELVAVYKQYDDYQKRTEREIPLVMLSRDAAA